MNHPLVSVIMATYNRADYLPQAINSILNQTYRQFELLIIDDGSTDKTEQILLDYAQRDSRIRLFHHQNAGGVVSRNKGLEHAQGKYIAMMDDDDISLPLRLEKQVAFLQSQPELAACVCYNYNVVDHQGRNLKKRRRKRLRLPNDAISLNTRLALPFILGPMTLITKQALQTCQGYRTLFTSAQDLDLTLRFQEKFQAGVVQEFLYQYRVPELQFGVNVSTHNLLKSLYCHIAAYISAWYRRNQAFDPLMKNNTPQDLINLVGPMPLISRKRIIKTMTPIIKRFRWVPNLTIEDMGEVIHTIHQLNPSSSLKSRFKQRQLVPLIKERRWIDLLRLLRL